MDTKCSKCCWNCTEPFTGDSYGYPTEICDGLYQVKGQFCDLACVKRFLLDRRLNETLMDLFGRMCFEQYGVLEVPHRVSPFVLQKFDPNGVSIDDYRSKKTLFVSTSWIRDMPMQVESIQINGTD